MMLAIISILSFYYQFQPLLCQSSISTEGAIARFGDNEIDGFVKVINGHIIFNLTINPNFDWSDLDSTSSYCLSGGLYYGIYESWSYTDTLSDKTGPNSCGPDYTGYRFDPWLACSTLSNNPYCISTGSSSSCIPANSQTWDKADSHQYICNQYNYVTNPYNCEIGDWSGKYGLLNLEEDISGGSYSIYTTYSSAFEVDSYDLSDRSILFRCQDNTRAFCSGFEEYKPTEEELDIYTRVYQDTLTYDIDDSKDSKDDDDTSDNNIYSMRAQFDDNNYVLLTYYNTYEIVFDSTSNTFDSLGGCGEYINIRIYNNWDENIAAGNCDKGNKYWDPIITCDLDTENGDTDGKEYCIDDKYICNDEEWFYECKDYYKKDSINNRIYCGPGDLSGKYGSIYIGDNINFGIWKVNGSDPKMAPMNLLEGKSVVLQCSSTKAIIDCAPLLKYTDDSGKIWGESDSDDNNNGNKKKNKNKGLFGLGETVLIVLLILALAAIVPCVKGCKKLRGDGEGEGKDDDNDGGNDNKRKRNYGRGRKVGKDDYGYDEESGNDGKSGMTSSGKSKRTVPSMQQGMAV